MCNERAARAMAAWEGGRRRRAAAAAVDRAADAALATGGIIFANLALPFGLELPRGAAGVSLALGLVCAGLAAISRRGHRGATPRRPQDARHRIAEPRAAVTARAAEVGRAA